jgi:hypothetical protein
MSDRDESSREAVAAALEDFLRSCPAHFDFPAGGAAPIPLELESALAGASL